MPIIAINSAGTLHHVTDLQPIVSNLSNNTFEIQADIYSKLEQLQDTGNYCLLITPPPSPNHSVRLPYLTLFEGWDIEGVSVSLSTAGTVEEFFESTEWVRLKDDAVIVYQIRAKQDGSVYFAYASTGKQNIVRRFVIDKVLLNG